MSWNKTATLHLTYKNQFLNVVQGKSCYFENIQMQCHHHRYHYAEIMFVEPGGA